MSLLGSLSRLFLLEPGLDHGGFGEEGFLEAGRRGRGSSRKRLWCVRRRTGRGRKEEKGGRRGPRWGNEGRGRGMPRQKRYEGGVRRGTGNKIDWQRARAGRGRGPTFSSSVNQGMVTFQRLTRARTWRGKGKKRAEKEMHEHFPN